MDPITFAALNLVIQDFENNKQKISVKNTPTVYHFTRRPNIIKDSKKMFNMKIKHPIIQPRGQNH